MPGGVYAFRVPSSILSPSKHRMRGCRRLSDTALAATIAIMIKAVIFDMDGLLIDSEPLWREAEIEVFASIGVPLNEELAHTTTGLRTDEVVEHWYSLYPWEGHPHKEIESRIVCRVIELIRERGTAKPGAIELIGGLRRRCVPLAIASSSSSEIIDAVIERLELQDAFAVLQSAEHEPYGKPHPGVYIAAAQALGAPPASCLALEDSANGLLAAKAAKMICFAVPDPAEQNDKRFCIADRVLSSLLEIDPGQLDLG